MTNERMTAPGGTVFWRVVIWGAFTVTISFLSSIFSFHSSSRSIPIISPIQRLFPTWTVVIFEACERLCYYAIANNSTHYIRGFIGEGTSQTSAIKSAFSFIGYSSSLIWGIVADTLLGRKRTLLTIGSIYAVFVIILVISTLPSLTHHVDLQLGQGPIESGKALFFLSYFGIAICMYVLPSSFPCCC